MTSTDAAPASSPPTTQQTSDRRKSGRAVRKPGLFAEEYHDGSLLSNGSAKRKRQPNGDTLNEPSGDEDEDENNESEGSANEEELKERMRQSRNKKATTKPVSKRARPSDENGTTLAIRSANVPSKSASQKAKAQKARSRQSQANQEGLYGKHSHLLRAAVQG
jgi:cohesin complex subunit SA-1/2